MPTKRKKEREERDGEIDDDDGVALLFYPAMVIYRDAGRC